MKLLMSLVFVLVLLASSVAAESSINILNNTVPLTGNVQQTLTGTFDLNNTGNVSVSVSFTNLTLSPTTVRTPALTPLTINTISQVNNLAAGATQTVSFSVPTGNSFATTYTGNVLASVTNNASATDSVAVTVTVNPSSNLTTTNPTLTVGKGTGKPAQFTLTNAGNTDLNSITLTVGTIASGTNTLPSSSIVLSKTSTSITFGSNEIITVTVTPPSTQATGTYSGPITISFGGANTATATLTATVRDATHSVKFNSSDIKLGSATQERNNTITNFPFTIENDGDFTETVNISLTNVASKFNAQLSKTATTLNPGTTETITLTLFVPADQSSGVQAIGQVSLGFNGVSTAKEIQLETVSKLKIDDVDVEVEGEDDTDLKDGETINEEAKPEDDVEFDIRVRNLFASNSDIDMDNVEVEVVIEDIDDDDDLDESKDADDIDADDTADVTLAFKVPLEVDEQTYDVIITAEGEDKNGATHTATQKLKLRVEKENDDVRITEFDLGSATLSCVRSTNLRVTIQNFGSDDQDDAALAVVNRNLGVNFQVDDIELDNDADNDDNEFSRTFDITVPSTQKAGTYQIEIFAFIENDEQEDKEIVNLKVQECEEEEEEETPTTAGTASGTQSRVLVEQAGVQQPPLAAGIAESVEGSFTQTPLFIGLLVFGNIVALGGLIVLVFKFLI